MALTLKVSESGTVKLPEEVVEAAGWTPGTEIEVSGEGRDILLRAKEKSRREELFPPITVKEFLARRTRYDGPPVTDEMMQQAVLDEAKRRWHAKNGG